MFTGYGALNSREVFAAARQGLESHGHTVVEHDWSADAAVIWSVLWNGRMASNHTVFEEFRRWGRPVIVLEVGCLNRGQTWRVSVLDERGHHYPAVVDDTRYERLGLAYKNRTHLGENILIACQRTDSLQWQGCGDIISWIDDVVKRVRLFTGRPIIVRPHPRQPLPSLPAGVHLAQPKPVPHTTDSFDFDTVLQNARVVINHNASPGIVATLAGVPVICGTDGVTRSLAHEVSIGYDEIESTRSGAKTTDWLNQIAHTEWSVSEIASGKPFEALKFNILHPQDQRLVI